MLLLATLVLAVSARLQGLVLVPSGIPTSQASELLTVVGLHARQFSDDGRALLLFGRRFAGGVLCAFVGLYCVLRRFGALAGNVGQRPLLLDLLCQHCDASTRINNEPGAIG